MVTHQIEEAVEMATRICVLFPHPGRIGLSLENPMPYPRDVQSIAFQKLVSHIHEAITTCTLPDSPPEKIDASLSPRFESIPCVAIGEILGLLSIVRDEPKTPNIYDIADQIGKEFGETLSIVKAAEILGLVETPRNDVTLTSAGLDFLSSDGPRRKIQLGDQLRRLRIFSHLFALLKMGSRVDASQILSDIALNHPYENARKMLQTIVSWGRYAGLMDYNTFTHQIVVPDNRPPTGAAEPANP
jgi:NitT/TauT family transport system ATP-binding protein